MKNKIFDGLRDESYVTVRINGEEKRAPRGALLSEIISGEKPCGGHGKCGKCRVVARGALSELSEAEAKLLSAEELSRGVRLACLTRAEGDCEIKTFAENKGEQIVTCGDLPPMQLEPAFERYGVAIDIGTTTLASRLYSVSGEILAEASAINPQQEWGADVISRIESALDGKADELACSIRVALSDMITTLTAKAKVDAAEVDGAVITGNTVMLSLLTGESVEPFSHAPFDAKRLFGETLPAAELGITSLVSDADVYLPPCISAFVGADITCAILATELCKTENAMLIDIGTNGEMALWHDGRLSVCSTAAGPAFEGVGISAGMRGAAGAIDKVAVENGSVKVHVIGDGTPVGICGSGIVDAMAALLELEVIDETGYLEDDEFALGGDVAVTQEDVRMVQLSKSAICAGAVTLTDTAGVAPEDIPVLYIAGGFGNYLNINSSVRIGLLPSALAENAVTVGNAAIAGASVMLLDARSRERLSESIRGAVALELSTSKVFSDAYIAGMMFEEV